jgi:6-phosphofructokinase 1
MRDKLAILAAGGPAPGINSVIGAATIRAHLSDVEVLGIQDGFRWLMKGDTSHVMPLSIADTSRIHFRGGSHIGIARGAPASDPATLERTLGALEQLGVGMLITIGGDGTAYNAFRVAEASAGSLRVVHVPKTIDNDIDLPNDTSTFGFQTARHVGCEIVENLMVDAKTTSRWYFVVAQGRKAGHLALSIGKAAGATVSLIPEELPHRNTKLRTVVDTLAGSIIKRLAYGRADGVAMLAEGLADRVDPRELEAFGNVPRDAWGNIEVAKIHLGEILKHAVEDRLAQFGLSVTIVSKTIGYELRCADPIPFDMEYTRDLGYCAARYIIEGGSNVMVAMVEGRFRAIPFEELMDLRNGCTRVRMVDIESDRYKIARTYMLRLKPEDFDDDVALARLSDTAHVTPEKFAAEFAHLLDPTIQPQPMSLRPSRAADPAP